MLFCGVSPLLARRASALATETYSQLKTLPPKLPKSQRNILVHQYWRVDLEVVWRTITQSLPPLNAELAQILQ